MWFVVGANVDKAAVAAPVGRHVHVRVSSMFVQKPRYLK
jgi:hypothetical protein